MNNRFEISKIIKTNFFQRKIFRITLITFSCLVFLVFTMGFGSYYFLKGEFSAPGRLSESKIVIIPHGYSVKSIGSFLHDQGVVDNSLVFYWGVRLFGQSKPLLSGEYEILPGMANKDVMLLLQSGKVVVRKITVPEGLTVKQIYDLLKKTKTLKGDLPSLSKFSEGSLLPETYLYTSRDSKSQILERMQNSMTELLQGLWNDHLHSKSQILSPNEVVILASIVERETSRKDERARIAGVFLNRLKLGMKLQSDPTVIYGISGGRGIINRPLTKSDLKTKSPYNTYTNYGLPWGPISNPGRASLIAVLNPFQTDELYFVADGGGGHLFARDLDNHLSLIHI